MAFHEAQVNLYVERVPPVAAFYERLGFVESFRTPTDGEPDHLEVRLGGLILGITTRQALIDNDGPELRPPSPTSEIGIWCDDVDGVVASLIAGGVPLLAGPQDHRGRRVAWIADPEGNLVHPIESDPTG